MGVGLYGTGRRAEGPWLSLGDVIGLVSGYRVRVRVHAARAGPAAIGLGLGLGLALGLGTGLGLRLGRRLGLQLLAQLVDLEVGLFSMQLVLHLVG